MRFVGIDPSTKTGLVILDRDGNVIDALEITSERGAQVAVISNIVLGTVQQLELGDIVAIEGFAYGAKGSAVGMLFGIGWGIRMEMHNRDIEFIDVAPFALKKFAGGKKDTKKDALAVEIYKRWGFEHPSDNVRDAYVLAQIARAMYTSVDGLIAPQREVIEAIRKKGA